MPNASRPLRVRRYFGFPNTLFSKNMDCARHKTPHGMHTTALPQRLYTPDSGKWSTNSRLTFLVRYGQRAFRFGMPGLACDISHTWSGVSSSIARAVHPRSDPVTEQMYASKVFGSGKFS